MTIEMLTARVAELEKQLTSVMSKMEVEKPKKVKKEKSVEPKEKSVEPKKVGEPKKKRGVSGYLLYAKEMRQSAKEALVENGNETPKPTEVLTQVAKMWRDMSEEDKIVWNDKAKALNSGSEDED